MRNITLLALLTSLNVTADEVMNFSCVPIEGETSFRIKGYFLSHGQGEHIGIAHSYAIFGKHVELEDCTAPLHEKFPLSGSTSIKFLLHWREYTPGCMQRLQIPQISAPGYMWIEKKEESAIRSNPIKTNCKLEKGVK